MNHLNTIQCVRAENTIKALREEITALKGKLRKKNIMIQEFEQKMAEIKRYIQEE